jgi:opacity protein-like surface antigen
MKKILSTIAVTAILSTGAFSAEFINGGAYGGVGMGFEDFSTYSSYDPGVTLVLNGGKPIIRIGPGTLGAEGELTYTVVPMSHSFASDLTVITFGAYATYTYDINQQLYARAKLGLVNRNYSWDKNRYYSDYNKVGEAIGIGAGYNLTNNMRAFTDIIALDGNGLKQLNFGLQVSF